MTGRRSPATQTLNRIHHRGLVGNEGFAQSLSPVDSISRFPDSTAAHNIPLIDRGLSRLFAILNLLTSLCREWAFFIGAEPTR
ncbi:MAG TPA: hypothetical protein VKG91_16790 [Roseiarcus sp.]|nr:hypothetical protein [Roseiarcus sp.]